MKVYKVRYQSVKVTLQADAPPLWDGGPPVRVPDKREVSEPKQQNVLANSPSEATDKLAAHLGCEISVASVEEMPGAVI